VVVLPTLTASLPRLRAILVPLVLLALLAVEAPAVAKPTGKVLYQDGNGGRFLLDGDWYFRLDPADQGLAQGLPRQPSLDGWGAVKVPHAWNATDLSDASQRGTVGWYRQDFRLPSGSRRLSWILRFESVNYRATVFLNGRQIGTHEAASVPFEVPAAAASRRGVNRLVIRVDNRRGDTDLPPTGEQDDGTPGGGWWNYGGLLREVYLRPIRGIDIDELEATPELRCSRCNAVVRLRARLENPKGGKRKVKLVVAVGNKTARFREVQISSGKVRIVTSRVKIRKPRLWRITDPELYSVRARAMIRRRTVASYSTNIGIRSIKVKAGRVLLNGKRVRLNGTSMHEDFPGRGAALRSAERKKFWRVLRGMNTRLLREHYPVHPWFL